MTEELNHKWDVPARIEIKTVSFDQIGAGVDLANARKLYDLRAKGKNTRALTRDEQAAWEAYQNSLPKPPAS